jgi:S1-C subfamily serine protease
MARPDRFPVASVAVLAVLVAVVIFALFSRASSGDGVGAGSGALRHPAVDYFGADVSTLRAREAQSLGVVWPTSGVVVDSVVAGCVACRSGLVPDDLVIAVNGQPVADRPRFWGLLASQPGPVLTLDVVRRGAPRQLTIPWEPDAYPPGAPAAPGAVPPNPCAVSPL